MKRQTGLSMIEVLIAVVILSVGLLAMAAMQIMSLQNISNSVFRTQAMLLAKDMADRMDANYIEARKDATNSLYQVEVNEDDPPPPPPAAVASCRTTAGCTSLQMAQDDYATWAALVAQDLPDGDVVVCRDNDASNDLDSDNSGTVDNNDDPCDPTMANVCVTDDGDGDGVNDILAPYTIRVCWSETGNRRDVDGDGDIDVNDRQLNEIILPSGRVLHQYTLSFQ